MKPVRVRYGFKVSIYERAWNTTSEIYRQYNRKTRYRLLRFSVSGQSRWGGMPEYFAFAVMPRPIRDVLYEAR